MLELPQWLHALATGLTLAGAGVWLIVRWLRIGRPRTEPGCSRCEHALPPAERASEPASRAVRSSRLRVL